MLRNESSNNRIRPQQSCPRAINHACTKQSTASTDAARQDGTTPYTPVTRPSAAPQGDSDPADALRHLYEHERAAWAARRLQKAAQGRSTRPCGQARAADPLWDRLATFCQNRDIEPHSYIQWVFDTSLSARPPEPIQLLNPQLADAYLAAARDFPAAVTVALRVQKQTARTYIRLGQQPVKQTPHDVWAAVLLDETLPLSALFRFGLATSIGGERFERIASRYEAAAARQYRRCPHVYDTVWGKWVPKRLRESIDPTFCSTK